MGHVYAITCPDGWYVGSTFNYAQRMREHWTRLKGGNHRNAVLQAAWDRLDPHQFEHETLQRIFECSPSNLRAAEQAWVDAVRQSATPCLNLANPKADTQLELPI